MEFTAKPESGSSLLYRRSLTRPIEDHEIYKDHERSHFPMYDHWRLFACIREGWRIPLPAKGLGHDDGTVEPLIVGHATTAKIKDGETNESSEIKDWVSLDLE